MPELTVVGWLWQGPVKYESEHANAWARMIHRNLTLPHHFVLVTDQYRAKFDPLFRVIIPLWKEWHTTKNPRWSTLKPSCYVRLKAFSDDARWLLGERFVSIDLDCVVLDSLDPLFDRKEDFLIFNRSVAGQREEKNTYNGSMFMMTAGARRQVWEDFKGAESIKAAQDYMGTDQAWIRYRLGPNEPGWSYKDGVYMWPTLMTDPRYRHEPPKGARIIFFNGNQKPWDFPSDRPPCCQGCGAEVKVRPPWQVSRIRGLGVPSHPWVGKFYG